MMKLQFLVKFSKDLDKIDDKNIKNKLIKFIDDIESAEKLSDIKNIKKITGINNAYRLRIGDYRIGIYFENEIIEFARIIHRKDIYKVFP